MKIEPLTKELAEEYEIERPEGVIVTEVEQGSVAEKKGFRPGDIITEVNQKSINTPKQFRDAIKSADSKRGIIINFITGGTSKFAVLKQNRD
jgi:S1-C subfamily serine protease